MAVRIMSPSWTSKDVLSAASGLRKKYSCVNVISLLKITDASHYTTFAT